MDEVDYERIFDALPSPFMILDRNLRFVTANAAYLETTSSTLDDLVGKYVMDRFPEPGESGRRLEQSFQKVAATGEADTLAYLPYPIAEPNGTVRHRYWTAVHVPILDARGQVEYILQNTVDVTEFARIREMATLPFSSLSAATRLMERTLEAEAASADFRRLFQQAPAFFAVLSGPTHIFTFSSDSYTRLIGGRNVIGRPIADALPEVVEQGFVDLLDQVYIDGHVHQAEGARVILDNEPGRPPQEYFLDFSYNPIRDSAGNITGIFVQGMDRTDAFRATQRQRLMIDELNHRVKNTLATVQSIASQTLRSTNDVTAARQAFEARISALAGAHTMLSDRQWHNTEIGHLVQKELDVFSSDKVSFGGPVLVVNAKATVALALVLHELATNAVKHGALSVPEGGLSVTWSESSGDGLVIDWVETGGPPAQEPTRKGFGSRLLRTVITGEMGGSMEMRYLETGLRVRMVIPRAAYQVQEALFVS
ncbi:sensor histidine kinase [Devosia sediminis]|uniref:Blue-light-activated histidine kinase n=1 Tax=Devosia sediminis TaxID=2798801 RepID=A0A934MKM4_9HYPH|nr:HWE histidine kinase domain-containing protein [Devosia sediminis]MBJ3783721.1 PAS domain-containing protein [Devosia sediminis]